MHILRRVAIAAVLVMAACASGDTAAPAETQGPATPTAQATEATEAGGDDAGGEDAGGSGSDFDCNDAMGTLLAFNQDYSWSVRRGTAPEPADYNRLADELEAFAATAPADIEATMDDWAGRIVPYWRDLATIGFDPSDPGSVDADAYAAATSDLDGPAVDQSAADLQEWLTVGCEDG